MNVVATLALSGGLFSVFAFVHFFIDWIFQSHSEAMIKHNNPKIRAKHCFIYTIGFVPLMWVLNFSFLQWMFGLSILFLSHFYLDTYHGVFLWAKYIRKPPEMLSEDPKNGFIKFVQTPIGKILMITIDQISHLMFLWILVYFAMQRLN